MGAEEVEMETQASGPDAVRGGGGVVAMDRAGTAGGMLLWPLSCLHKDALRYPVLMRLTANATSS